ncbi:lipopolysaccharide biosynthesis protein [Pseudoruegeria sp. HB172150]|uniref:lipopolysaccharide biosynthesis protein n=1 Tax=Pseudoruegeria sp. HB172150 TaxID=2721164 RepID=UPI0015567345|nr:hypothetical protein [Pseudoruegeria sp. HB172150]
MSAAQRNTASRYVLNATSSIVTMLLRMGALVWVNQFLIHRIAPEEYALVPVVASLLVIAEILPLIFMRGLSRFMVEADARQDTAEMTRIVSSMVPVLTAVAMVLLVGGLLATVNIDSVINVAPEYRWQAQAMLLMLVAVLCLRVALTPFRVGLHVRMRFVEENMILLATEVLRVVLLVFLLLAVSTQVIWVTVSTCVANVVNMLILIGYTVRIIPDARLRLSAIAVATVKRLLSFSLWTLFQAFNNLVLRAVPALLLNRNASAIDVASFHIGNLADTQIRRLAVAATAPAKPALTTIYATEGEDSLQKFYYLGGRYYLWVTLFLLPPLLVFAYPLIELYAGARYLKAAPVMVMLLGVYPFVWASGMFYEVAYSVGRIRSFNICIMILSLAALGGMWYLVVIRDLGALGAAMGLSGSYAIVHLLIMWPAGLWLVKGTWPVFVGETLVRGIAPFVAACLACAAFGYVFPITSWGGFFLGSAVSALVYPAVLIGLCLSESDKVLMQRAVHKIRGRFSGKRSKG